MDLTFYARQFSCFFLFLLQPQTPQRRSGTCDYSGFDGLPSDLALSRGRGDGRSYAQTRTHNEMWFNGLNVGDPKTVHAMQSASQIYGIFRSDIDFSLPPIAGTINLWAFVTVFRTAADMQRGIQAPVSHLDHSVRMQSISHGPEKTPGVCLAQWIC